MAGALAAGGVAFRASAVPSTGAAAAVGWPSFSAAAGMVAAGCTNRAALVAVATAAGGVALRAPAVPSTGAAAAVGWSSFNAAAAGFTSRGGGGARRASAAADNRTSFSRHALRAGVELGHGGGDGGQVLLVTCGARYDAVRACGSFSSSESRLDFRSSHSRLRRSSAACLFSSRWWFTSCCTCACERARRRESEMITIVANLFFLIHMRSVTGTASGFDSRGADIASPT